MARGWRRQFGNASTQYVGKRDASVDKDQAYRIDLSAGKMVFVGLVVIGLIWAGWHIIADTVGYNAATSSPETAVAWTPNDAAALDELAYRELTKSGGNLNAARSLAERVLRANPLDARALSVLGQIAEKEGDQARAGNLMRLSGARTWRDTTTQAWLLKYEIQTGHFEQALMHIDAILRTNPRYVDQTIPVFAAFTVDQRTFDTLTQLLATNPPWRAQVLPRLSAQLSDAGRLTQLYAALKDSQNPPVATELRPYLDRLIKDGQYKEAYQSWRATLSPDQQKKQPLLYNGDFAFPIDGLPFNWHLQPFQGVNIQVVAAPDKDKDRALRFQFSGTRASFAVGQLMLLPPGEYRFTGNVRAQELRTERGLEWQISCAEAPNNILARTDLVARTTPWANFSVGFTVPTQDCRSQWLKLDIASRTASERQIEGQVWYENLQIGAVTQR